MLYNVYDKSVKNLRDAYAADVPVGSMMYPSSVVLKGSKGGNYYLEDLLSFAPDADIFPAVVVENSGKTFMQILTPTGVHAISKFSLISYEKS